jgi:hypothetical protein
LVDTPHPGCFWKRGCKWLKTKDGSRKSKAKRLQAVERARVRGGVANRQAKDDTPFGAPLEARGKQGEPFEAQGKEA